MRNPARFRLAAIFAVAGMLTVSLALAQREQPRPAQDPNARQPAAAPGGMSLDHMLAHCLIIENENQIKLSEFAQDKAQDKDVKEFARKMQEEHQQLIAKFEKIGHQGHGPAPAADPKAAAPRREAPAEEKPAVTKERDDANPPDRKADDKPRADEPRAGAKDDPNQPRKVAGDGRRRGDIQLQIKRELAEQSLQTMKRELGQKSGAEFDQCFMFAQVYCHLHEIDTLKVFTKHASPEFQKTLAEAQKHAETHLAEARELAKRTEQAALTTAQREKAEKKTE